MGIRNQDAPELDRTIAAWRRTGEPDAELSAETRARIRAEFRRSGARSASPRPFAALFVPTARIAWGAALPLAVLSLIVVSALGFRDDVGGVPLGSGTRVQAMKSGDEVVFLIKNGKRPHRISKSDSPGDFGRGPVFTTTTGSFRDSLSESSNIVYYRID